MRNLGGGVPSPISLSRSQDVAVMAGFGLRRRWQGCTDNVCTGNSGSSKMYGGYIKTVSLYTRKKGANETRGLQESGRFGRIGSFSENEDQFRYR